MFRLLNNPLSRSAPKPVDDGSNPVLALAAGAAQDAVKAAEIAAKAADPYRVHELPKATNAQEALERYMAYRRAGNLRVGLWHSVRDGRHVACALGALGEDVSGSHACPAQIMPAQLAMLVPNLFDSFGGPGSKNERAFAWGEAFYRELARLDGRVPRYEVERIYQKVRGNSSPGKAWWVVKQLRKVKTPVQVKE